MVVNPYDSQAPEASLSAHLPTRSPGLFTLCISESRVAPVFLSQKQRGVNPKIGVGPPKSSILIGFSMK